MRTRLRCIAVLLILYVVPAFAAGDRVQIKTDNGLNVSVQACTDRIFRVRISPREEHSVSLMERYGIIRTDWNASAEISDIPGGKQLTTQCGRLSVNSSDGTVNLFGKDGKLIVGDIVFHKAGSPLVKNISNVINEKFEAIAKKSSRGIIGDANGSHRAGDSWESGDPAKSSIVSIAVRDGERFYGGGGTSREHIQHRGEMLRMWATYRRTEIPIPFIASSAGWGIYSNDTRKSYFDIASTNTGRFNIYTINDEADFFIFAGDSHKHLIKLYTQITGTNYVLPKWAYGLCFGPHMREDQWDILNDAVRFRDMEIPCDLIWLEPQWMAKHYDFSTGKKFNTDRFTVEPHWKEKTFPKKFWHNYFIGRLRDMGYHLGLWLCEEFDLSVKEEDNLAKAESRPLSGQEHWMEHLRNFMDLGVEGFKLDPARTLNMHPSRKYYNSHNDSEMHNLNQVLLQKQMQEMTRDYNGKRSWHHYCGGWAGEQQFGASTSGDNGGGKTALFDQLNIGMSGYMNTSCDVMHVSENTEMQSLHFGIFLPWMQINSWFYLYHPFYYSKADQKIYKDYLKLRYSLMPYTYSAALEGSMSGLPIVRSMPLEFPEDRNVDDMSTQYMFGENLCVGIFTKKIYLPEGAWTDFWTGEKIESKGETFSRNYPADRAGLLFVREGAIIPCQPDVQFISEEPLDTVIVKVYPGRDASSYTLYEDDGISYGFRDGKIASTRFECRPEGKIINFTIGKVSGEYAGMKPSRSYVMNIALDRKPAMVSVNGKKTKDWIWNEGVLKFVVPDLDVHSDSTFSVKL